ncbi:major capsid protein [Sagittula sp. MA-2]|jgi:hypothetical protein|uniref:major capsid protein n=1 Tax=Sagittula sp. MA-2 TaxID=3048007 RepID=UPI0024C22CE5|nr:major capsid protein [Sagittula sp. MA-2]WHZ36495.1 major capsid protein [Sagittula sp. MA-2]
MSFIFDLFTQESPDGSLGSVLAGVVESIPHTPSRIGGMGLYRADSLLGTTASFDVTDMTLELIDPIGRGDQSSFVDADPYNLVLFKAHSFKRSAKITEEEVRDIRALGEAAFVGAKAAMARKLRKPLLEVRMAREWQMLGGIRGYILDKNGNVISNIFNKLGVEAPAVEEVEDSAFSGDGDFNTFCSEKVDQVADELGADGYDHVHCFVTSARMRWIANLQECREAYRYQQGQTFLQAKKGYGTTFEYGGVTFETYRGKINGVDFVSDDEMVFFPVGADNFYAGYAPSTRIVDPATGAELEEGKIGQPEFYIPFIDPRGEFEEVQVQSHPLILNLKPRTTIVVRIIEAAEPAEEPAV